MAGFVIMLVNCNICPKTKWLALKDVVRMQQEIKGHCYNPMPSHSTHGGAIARVPTILNQNFSCLFTTSKRAVFSVVC